MSTTPAHIGRHRRLLPLAFAGIAVLFAATQWVSWQKATDARRETQKIVTSMMTSMTLVSRMNRDVDTQRFIIDEHILETRELEQQRFEEQVEQLDLDFAAAAAEYEAIAKLPGESVAWQRVRAGVAALEQPRAAVLALSRVNRDVEASAAMTPLDKRFTDIDRDMSDLIELNRRGVDHSAKVLAALHRSTASELATLGLIGIVATLLVGAWTTSLVLRHEAQLTRYSRILEGQNEELDAFAGRVAHDLRAPLGTVSLAASLLSHHNPPGDRRVLDRLTRGVWRMEALIRDLLMLSRVGVELHDETCDPHATSEQLREDFVVHHESEGAVLTVEVEPAEVRGKADLLRQVLWNLTDNAVKYRRDGITAEVTIAGHAAGARYELRVSDNGTGMTADDVAQIFEPFHRSERTRDRPGTGLGMSIVKRIIDASGGEVRVESELGSGTTVVINLQLVQARLRDAA